MTEDIKKFILFLINPKSPFLFMYDGTIINVDIEEEMTIDEIYEGWKDGRFLDS